ncbi:MAG: methylamine dehydrogenase heavy chain [Halomonas sp. 54_146]|nr:MULTISPECIES: amine dehydrogenase large subunit [unclassified Halomonas]KUJ87073.1 MAG: methylamine dehydrogenase heavy chain [Halomonas sp. 54_146]HAA45247.1 amine dehydrogenase [Halomonas sp.]
MNWSRFTLIALGGVTLGSFAHASEDFVPEELTVMERIKPGPNVFVLDQLWSGASRANVISQEDLTVKGNLSFGIVGQIVTSHDSKTLYSMSAYAERISYGPTEVVLQEFDVDTLSLKREIVIPEKAAQVAPSNAIVALSYDDNYAFVQNATPATSVSVVDLTSGEFVEEVPTPGCFGIFPASDSVKFTTACGDGRFQSFSLGNDNQFGSPEPSEKIFDPTSDPIFIVGKRAGDELVFVSFFGNVYQVSDSGDMVSLTNKFAITDGVEGGWAPGGVDVAAYNEANDVLFVTMHSDAYNGSHKNAAEEVWAVELSSGDVLSRSPVHELASISVTDGETPILFGLDEESTLTRFEVDVGADFELEPTSSLESVGDWTVYSIAGK